MSAIKRSSALTSAAVLAAILVLLTSSGAAAHTRSLSFSSWTRSDSGWTVTYTVAARTATLLNGLPGADGAIESRLVEHVLENLQFERGGVFCQPDNLPVAQSGRDGMLRLVLRLRCPPAFADAPGVVTHRAFLAVSPSHVHFARFRAASGGWSELLLTRDKPQGELPPPVTPLSPGTEPDAEPMVRYVKLGVSHILGGWDHLAFVAALLLVVRGWRRLAILVTGFTFGHSLTLALATVGLVRADPRGVEAIIGFTVAVVAAEAALRQGGGMRHAGNIAAIALVLLAMVGGNLSVLTWLGLVLFVFFYSRLATIVPHDGRHVPMLTVIFGMAHGLGFAGVLLDLELPANRLATTLLGFNLGVELGQLLVLAVLVAGTSLARPLLVAGSRTRIANAAASGLCGLGVMWFVLRAFA